ncbi:MAG: MBL fold metallo-hydrolase [Eubacteriales bacterium]|nr:MBL fold metallo-hydrolase [Eubacteriales bacterium]
MNDWIGQVTFINVGYGEAILVEISDPSCQDGTFVMLIDGGSAEAAEYDGNDTGRIRTALYLEKQGIRHIDLMVNTHIHEDHTCGLLSVAEEWKPRVLWQPFPADLWTEMGQLRVTEEEADGHPKHGSTSTADKFRNALNDYRRLCRLVTGYGGEVVQIKPQPVWRSISAQVRVLVLTPDPETMKLQTEDMIQLYREGREELLPVLDGRMNHVSLAFQLEYAGKRFLLAGDLEAADYGKIFDGQSMESNWKADVFKVGHHGQANGLTQDILKKIEPEHAVICASSDRRYRSAAPEVLKILKEQQVEPWFSDCPDVSPDTDGLQPHEAVRFRVLRDGRLQAEYQIK